MAATFDYASLRDEKLAPLFPQFGRDLTLLRAARTTTLTADPNRRWESTAHGDATTVAVAAAQCIEVSGIFLSVKRADRLGQLIESPTQGVLILAASTLPEEIGPDWQVDDCGKLWEVVSSDPLHPGSELLIYRFALAL